MAGILSLLDALLGLEAPGVLATLVRVEGSSYRRPGARLLVGAEGLRAGGVSAGCLEQDVALRAREVLAEGRPRLVEYALGTELDLLWGSGMGCEGRATLLLQPVAPRPLAPWIPFSAQKLARRRSVALATVLATEGMSACALGETFAYDEEGHGLLPMDRELSVALHHATRRALAEDAVFETCVAAGSGEATFLVEALRPPFALWIYGAGETGRPLARLAQAAGWDVAVLDHRPALATAERFPGAALLRAGDPREILPRELDARCAAVVLSHVYDRDREALAAFLASGAGYVGLMGSRGRSAKLLRELEAERGPLSSAQRARLHAPVGLDLGAEGPEEIALAILAEALAFLRGRSGGSLRAASGRLHG